MVVDVRANVRCNLGPLISGSISDDYIQGNGLIKTSGNCQISGIIYPQVGSTVTFQYTKNNITRTIPRSLKVLSSFADPFRRITTVELGCQLTYMQDVREPINWDALDDPENAGADSEDQSIVILPISAQSVALECMNQIGITGDIPLTNKFSIAKFDFSAGYVDILSNLLVSESYCGYLGVDGELKVFPLTSPGGETRVILQDELIDIGPIGVGDLPGDAVIVSYNTLRLKNPDNEESEDDRLKRNWEKEETIGSRTEVILEGEYNATKFPNRTEEQRKWINYFSYIPKSTTVTWYDSWDRVVKKSTVDQTILAEANPEYTKQWISITGYGPIGNQYVWKMSTTVIKYKKSAPELPSGVTVITEQQLEEGYDEVLEEVTTVYEPEVIRLGAIAGNYYDEANDFFCELAPDIRGNFYFPESYPIIPGQDVDDPRTISQRTTTTYETYSRNLSIKGENGITQLANFPITKTITKNEKIFGQTPRGQQYIAVKTEEGKFINSFAAYVNRLVDAGIETRTVSGREAVFQGRPSSVDRNASALADGGDPNNGYRTESSSELEFVSGEKDAKRRVEFSMPYAPDDIFVKSTVNGQTVFSVVSSDAKEKAALFGRTQNTLLLGNRNGINIQVAPDVMPTTPYSPIAIQANGLTGIYATNATSWTMDANGIIASTDALFIGAFSKA